MSAIAGILSLDRQPVEAEPAERMARRLGWRGPDDDGSYRSPDGWAALACHRLAVAADDGAPTLPLANETHDVWMALDGEIDNYRALRHSLELAGHRFRSAADAEVAVHAYEQWDLDFATHLQGHFAIALWDDRRDRLVLVRDRLGRKPLYFGTRGGLLAFASGIGPVADELGLPRRIDPVALAQYLTLGCVPAPRSIAAGVSKLGPAEMLVADRGHAPRRMVWGAFDPESRRAQSVRGLPLDRHAGNIRTLLECAVADRMMAPESIGVALDGGAGAGAVAAIAGRLTGRPVQAVAVVDAAARDGEAARDARQIAAAARAELVEVAIGAEDAAAALRPLVSALPEPVADAGTLAGWFAARAALESGLAALLSAEGADELLLGHPAYGGSRRSSVIERLSVLVPPLGRALTRRAAAAGAAAPDPLAPFGTEGWRHLLGEGGGRVVMERPVEWLSATADRLERLGACDLAWRVADGLTLRADAAALAHGLEARLPFLDEQLVAYTMAVPAALRSPAGSPRLIVKRAFGDLLPPGLAARPETPPPLPLDCWLTGGLGSRLAEMRSDLIAIEPVRALLARHRAEGGHGPALWALLMLLEWTEAHGFAALATEGDEPPAGCALSCGYNRPDHGRMGPCPLV